MNEIKQGHHKFFIGDNENQPIAEITYQPKDDNTIIVDHTYVSEQLRGQGIAGNLVKVMTDFARKEGKKIVPKCPYVEKKMNHNKEYHDLIAE